MKGSKNGKMAKYLFFLDNVDVILMEKKVLGSFKDKLKKFENFKILMTTRNEKKELTDANRID